MLHVLRFALGDLGIVIIPVHVTRHVVSQVDKEDAPPCGPVGDSDVAAEGDLPESSSPAAMLAACTASPIVYSLDRDDGTFVSNFVGEWKKAKKAGKAAVVQVPSKDGGEVREVEVRANPYARTFRAMPRGEGKRVINPPGPSGK